MFIKDAHNVSLANIIDEAPNAGTKPILVVCYTDQTAGRAVGLLKLMGFNAKSLKWGMIKEDLSVLEKFQLIKELGFDGIELDSPNDR